MCLIEYDTIQKIKDIIIKMYTTFYINLSPIIDIILQFIMMCLNINFVWKILKNKMRQEYFFKCIIGY